MLYMSLTRDVCSVNLSSDHLQTREAAYGIYLSLFENDWGTDPEWCGGRRKLEVGIWKYQHSPPTESITLLTPVSDSPRLWKIGLKALIGKCSLISLAI